MKIITRIILYTALIILICYSYILTGKAKSIEMTLDQDSLKKLLPTDNELPGWKNTDLRFFEPGNLWEYINGQAELYLQYGFQLVATSDYTSKDGSSELTIDIYQMESPLHAFGIYAAERSPEDNFIEVGVQGYIAEDILNFWKGPYYVKITSLEFSDSIKDNLNKFAEVIAHKISGEYSEPEFFTLFPIKNKIKMSERYIPHNFLGHRFLENGYRVDYQKEGKRYQVFLIENNSTEEAKKAFAQYHNFLKSNSEIIDHEMKFDHQEIKVQDYKKSIIFQYGSFIGGVLRINEFAEGDQVIEELLTKLRNRK